MPPSPPTVFLVDDEPGMRKALSRLLGAEGFKVRAFPSAKAFLDSYREDESGCLVLDIAMPDLGGLELQERLSHSGILLPVVFLTGRGDIPMTVQAIKAGAVDFLTKPVNDEALLSAVRAALQRAEEQHERMAETANLRQRHGRLTPREAEVMRYVVAGHLNKQIAAELGIGEQTIKVHRSRVMKKMGVESLADLVRAAEHLGLSRPVVGDP